MTGKVHDPTRDLAKAVMARKLSYSSLSNKTGIPYMRIYNSISKNGYQRRLYVDEYFKLLGLLEGYHPDFEEYERLN